MPFTSSYPYITLCSNCNIILDSANTNIIEQETITEDHEDYTTTILISFCNKKCQKIYKIKE